MIDPDETIRRYAAAVEATTTAPTGDTHVELRRNTSFLNLRPCGCCGKSHRAYGPLWPFNKHGAVCTECANVIEQDMGQLIDAVAGYYSFGGEFANTLDVFVDAVDGGESGALEALKAYMRREEVRTMLDAGAAPRLGRRLDSDPLE